MANRCDTTYKITGEKTAVNNLYNALQSLGASGDKIWLCDLAKHYGIDYEKKCICVRGVVYFYGCEDFREGLALLTIDTDTAWSACHELFETINCKLEDELSISYREIEPGEDIYCVHDEQGFFPEQCCVSCSGEDFGDWCEEFFPTVEDAIKHWCEKMNYKREGETTEQMEKIIGEWKYECSDTYFYINHIIFE